MNDKGNNNAVAIESPPGKQKIKSEKLQSAILDATITCLVEVGYGETSLNGVAARAQCSKGALQHHFPSKEDLIIATANRLLERTVSSPSAGPHKIDSVAAAIMYSWKKLINQPPYRALLEILNAARTDRALEQRISPTLRKWNKTLDQRAVATFSSPKGDREVKQLMIMTRSFMRGLIIHERYGATPAENLKHVKKWIAMIEPQLKLK